LSTDGAWKLFDLVTADLKPLSPKLLIVSGDFVDHPEVDGLTKVQHKLEGLCQDLGIDSSQHLVIIPGNHDYRVFGSFGRESVEGKRFGKVFPNWRKSSFHKLPNRNVAMFVFDSNTNDPKLNLARGRVGDGEYAQFQKDFNQMQSDHPTEFDSAFKIAVLHHHPLPIADTEIDAVTDRDAFLALDDAGTFLREMVEKRVDLVLHGHKHYPFFARAKFATTRFGEREVNVLGAGSACKPNAGGAYGNSYNIIRLKGDGIVEVEQRHRITGNFRTLHQLKVLSYEEVRNRLHENAGCNVAIESETDHCLVSDIGDCECTTELRNLRAKEGAAPEVFFPIEMTTTPGTFGRTLTAYSRSSAVGDPRWEPSSDCTGHCVKGKLRFSQPVDSHVGPISFDYSFRIFNAFALTAEQHRRMYGNQDPESFSTLVRYPLDMLFITIRYPSEIRTAKFEVVVEDANNQTSSCEQAWCRQHLHVSELTRTAILVVPKPLLGHRYRVRWQLPSETEAASSGELRQIGKACLIRSRLLELTPRGQPPSSLDNPVQKVLGGIKDELRNQFKSGDPAEDLEVGLMVYDERAVRLRHVAGIIRPEYWNWDIYEGEGVAGRAHKLNQAILYVRAAAKPELDWYTRPPASLLLHEVVFSVPLRYPIDRADGTVVGVLSVASTSQASRLLQLYGKEEDVKNLIGQIHKEYFQKRILPAIGLEEPG
jgi:3',5'-cyclic AMP phosphodiesterase CpdA